MIATGTAIALGIAAASAGSSVAAAKMQSNASGRAVDAQTNSANLGAKLSSDATQRSLDYVKEKDAADRQDFYRTERANYDQFAARDKFDYEQFAGREQNLAPYRAAGQGAQTTLSGMLGLPAANLAPTPSYQTPEMPEYLRTVGGMAQPQQGGQNYQQLFQGLTNGKPPTPEALTAMGPELQKYGISLAPNAAGVNGKIKLPTGQIVDVIEAAGQGGKNWQWLTGSGGQVMPRSQPQMPQPAYSQAPTLSTMGRRPQTPALEMPNPYSIGALAGKR